jgi:hypothetical protein
VRKINKQIGILEVEMSVIDKKIILKKIYHFLLSQQCQHPEIIADWIDVDVERSIQINYCAKCWKTFS